MVSLIFSVSVIEAELRGHLHALRSSESQPNGENFVEKCALDEHPKHPFTRVMRSCGAIM